MNAKVFAPIALTTLSLTVSTPIAKAALSPNGLSANGLSLHGLSDNQSMPSTGMSLSSSQFQSIRVQDGHLIGTP